MSNNMLSQSDIDALVSNMSAEEQAAPAPAQQPAAPAQQPAPPAQQPAAPAQQPAAPPPAAETPAQPPPAQAPADAAAKYPVQKLSMKYPEGQEPPAVDNTALANLQAINAKLQDRINRLETKVQKLEQLEKFRSGVTVPVTADQMKEANRKIQELQETIKQMNLKLQGTLGYDIYHTFTCEKCGTKEHVSTVFKCTHCGHESWLGWRARH